MSFLSSDRNEEYLEDNREINNYKMRETKNNKISKYFRGIWIYFKDYVLFLKGSTIKLCKIVNYTTYHWGFQMIMVLGMIQSYGVVNIMAGQFAPHLVKEGEIE